jgi:hypothetical protein
MARSALLPIVSCLALAAAVAAQAGNEVLFVGSSTSGTTDLHAFVASGAPSLIASGPSTFTNNVSDAAWSDTGRSLYVAQTVSNRVSVGAWNGVALLAFGTSNTSANGLPLPLPLTGIGMTGCNLLVDSQFSAAVAGPGAQGSFGLPIPANPALFQVSVYCQSFPLDPAANAFGFTASEGGDIRLGY